MNTQAPPATGARLTPQAVEALIARRLDALGHRPDLLAGGAIAALVADAGGSGRRLRSSLAATLFLASTEDAPEIDAALVHRALAPPVAAPAVVVHPFAAPEPAPALVRVPLGERPAVQPGPMALAQAARPRRATASRFYVVAAVVALVVSLGSLVLRQPTETPVPASIHDAPAQQPATPLPQPPAAGVPDQSVPSGQPPPAVVAQPAPAPISAPPTSGPPTSARQALIPLPPAVAVRSLPVPTASQPPAASDKLPPLPSGAPVALILLYPARDTGALARLRPIAERLQKAGVTDIRAKSEHAPAPRRVISYFYAEDRPLADSIAKILDGSVWPRLRGNSLQPSLVLPPAGLPGRNPGTIEVQLP